MDQDDFFSHVTQRQNIPKWIKIYKMKPSCGKSHDFTPGTLVTNKPNGLGNVSILRVTFEMLPSGLGIFNFGSSSDSFDSLIFRFLANMFAI